MSFLTRHQSIVIAGREVGRELAAGREVFVSETPSINESGWDTNVFRYLIGRDLTAEQVQARYPHGRRIADDRAWWIVSARPVPAGPGLTYAEVTAKGWAGSRPAKVNWTTDADQQSAENVVTPAGTYAKVSTHEAAPGITVSYLTEDAAAVSAANPVGRAASLPMADPHGGAIPFPSVPATVWASLAEYVYHWPNGWVLLDLNVDLLPGTNVGLVNLTLKHIRDISPG